MILLKIQEGGIFWDSFNEGFREFYIRATRLFITWLPASRLKKEEERDSGGDGCCQSAELEKRSFIL